MGLRDEQFLWSLGKKAATTYVELLSRAQKYISVGKLLCSKGIAKEKNIQGEGHKEKSHRNKDRLDLKKRKIERGATSKERLSRKGLPPSKFEQYTPTMAPLEQILMEI